MTKWTQTIRTASTGSGGNIQDASILPRIVGFYEYKNALDNFNELLRISSADEVKVYDDILKWKAEFGYFIGKPVDVVADHRQVAFSKVTKVQGLHWMTALARVELGAMLSGFTDLEDPFQEVPPSRFDLEEYLSLLNEGWSSHLFGVSRIAKGTINRLPFASPERNKLVIKNARRAKLTAEMIAYSAEAKSYRAQQDQNKETDPSQALKEIAQLQLAYQELQDYREQLGKELISQFQSGGLTSQTRQYTSTEYDPGIRANYPDLVRSCARAGMERAMREGNFQLTPIN